MKKITHYQELMAWCNYLENYRENTIDTLLIFNLIKNKNMKNIKLYLLSLTLISFISCEKGVSPSGSITKVEKNFSNFSSIEIEDGFKVIITSNNSEKVEIETNENIQQYVIATQTGNKIRFKRAGSINFGPRTTITIYISATKITEIYGSGGSLISTNNQIVTDNLTTEFSGGSIFTSSLKCNSFTTTISGGSKLNLTGSSDNYVLNSTGGSIFNGFDFIAKKFTCDVSGGGIVNITVTDKLDVKASGGSIITYKGGGIVNTQSLTGGSKIDKL
jgi:hypothetical protein